MTSDPIGTTRPAGWLELLVQWVSLSIVAVGLVGLPLLLVGWFKPYLVLPLSIVVWIVLVLLRNGARLSRPARPPLSTHLISAAAVVVAAVDVVVNARQATEHLLVDGDPAVYGMTGKWIAEHGSLNIPIHPAWFGNDTTINYMTNGFFLRSDGQHLYPQFFHLLPVLLGVCDWFTGTGGLLHLNMLLGGFALLAVFAFATRMMHPIWALAAMVTLSMTLPQVFFTRDTYSEIPSEFLVFAGLALLCDATSTRPRRPGAAGLLAGLTIGASTMTRIDAFAYIPAVVAAVAVLALVVKQADPRRARQVRVCMGVAVGLTVSGLVAVADAAFGSPIYAKSVASQLVAIGAATVLVVAAAWLLLTHRGAEDRTIRAARWLPRLAPAVGCIIVVGLAVAWLIRPLVQHVHETGVLNVSSTIANMQRNEHVQVDPTRHYNEMSMRWISWYLGPITLSLAILGFGYLAYRVLRGRDLHTLPFLLLAGSVTAGYVYDPLIVPVQYWATRRFVPVTLPAMVILAFFVLARVVASARQRRADAGATARNGDRVAARHWVASRRWVAAGVGVALAAAVLVTPIVLLQGPVRLVRAYVPVRDAVNRVCDALRPSDVVLLVGYGAQTNGFVQTIETYCGETAAISGVNTEPGDITHMARAAAASGHRLVLISSQQKPVDLSGKPLGMTLGTVVTSVVFDTEALSLTHRPDSDYKVALPIYMAPAATG